jgi:RHS repeat-associated protein
VPFGEVFVEERNATWSTPYKFNGKEQDEETGLCYYGARYYDPRTSVWLSVDPLAEKYPEVSSYVYCHNNPVNMIDPDGRWDVSVHTSTDRGKHPYAVYVVTDRTGNVIYKTVVRVTGAGGRTRNATNADTPQGRYKILEWRKTGNAHYPTRSYGPNDLLALEYQGGEGGKRQGMHTHGKGTEKPNELGVTNGCMRMSNDDIKELKEITTELEQNDPKETKGFLTVKDDLNKPVSYADRDTYKKEEKTYNGGVLKEVVVTAKREKQ